MTWRFFSRIRITSIAVHAASEATTDSTGEYSFEAMDSPKTIERSVPVVPENRWSPSWRSVTVRIFTASS